MEVVKKCFQSWFQTSKYLIYILASTENTHIMADDTIGENSHDIILEEVKEVKKAALKNFIFMDDK